MDNLILDSDADVIGRLQAGGRLRSATALGTRRHTLFLDREVRPEPLVAELAALGGQVVSVQPVRDTLEDLFVRQVAAARGRAAAEVKP